MTAARNIEDALRSILPPGILDTEGTAKTPERMAKALRELTEGYHVDLGSLITTFPVEGDGGIVCVRGIRFVSLCEHHVMPFVGEIGVAYLPSDRIIGLSKIPRIVRAVTRRLQVQERIGVQIARALDIISPRGVCVVVEGQHSCMSHRGIEAHGTMVTSLVEGVFREDATARAEVLGMLKGGRDG